MSDPSVSQHTLWILVRKDGKWVPLKKMDGGLIHAALSQAEQLDKSPDYKSVKVVRIANRSGEQKEIWVSSREQARIDAQLANQLSKGVAQTAAQFAPKK